ncbi:hypothetical protein HanPSC8_Chr08g0309241 [Helianthus annuus]|nr:hypothetical protein HanPSC8_Chr08g0309241 [Helianthus annuus]
MKKIRVFNIVIVFNHFVYLEMLRNLDGYSICISRIYTAKDVN